MREDIEQLLNIARNDELSARMCAINALECIARLGLWNEPNFLKMLVTLKTMNIIRKPNSTRGVYFAQYLSGTKAGVCMIDKTLDWMETYARLTALGDIVALICFVPLPLELDEEVADDWLTYFTNWFAPTWRDKEQAYFVNEATVRRFIWETESMIANNKVSVKLNTIPSLQVTNQEYMLRIGVEMERRGYSLYAAPNQPNKQQQRKETNMGHYTPPNVNVNPQNSGGWNNGQPNNIGGNWNNGGNQGGNKKGNQGGGGNGGSNNQRGGWNNGGGGGNNNGGGNWNGGGNGGNPNNGGVNWSGGGIPNNNGGSGNNNWNNGQPQQNNWNVNGNVNGNTVDNSDDGSYNANNFFNNNGNGNNFWNNS